MVPYLFGNWFTDIYNEFYRVIIDGNGYNMLLNGLGTTLILSIGGAVLGIIIGILVALMRFSELKNNKKNFFSVLAGIYIDIIRGTPSMVQIMIIYYVIFSSYKGNPVFIGIIAFGINSGAYVAEIIRGGIVSIDKGQMEAGRSLGLSYASTMSHIIIPQAIKVALPSLANEFIVLIKETAIIGYISLIDLTKAADYIIGRKFNAFIPLITIAIIYYIIIKLLTSLFRHMERRIRASD